MKLFSPRFALGIIAAFAASLPAQAFDFMGGRWERQNRPVPYAVNPDGAPAGFAEAVRKAAQTWSQDRRFDFAFTDQGNTDKRGKSVNDGQQVIYFSPNGNGLSETTLAVTYTWTIGSAMHHFDMEFNGQHRWSTNPQGWEFDFESVALHEFGHALGLAHSDIWGAVMYPSIRGSQILRAPHVDDVAGVASLYPPGSRAPAPSISVIEPRGQLSSLEPSFRWTPITGANRYALRCDRLASGTRRTVLSLSQLTEASYRPGSKFSAGNYIWSVQAFDDQGLLSESGDIAFELQSLGPEKVQQILAPGALVTQPQPMLAWSATANTSEYHVVVMDLDSRQYIVQNRVSGTSLIMPTALRNGGNYYWWVRSSDGVAASDWTASRFSVQIPGSR